MAGSGSYRGGCKEGAEGGDSGSSEGGGGEEGRRWVVSAPHTGVLTCDVGKQRRAELGGGGGVLTAAS